MSQKSFVPQVVKSVSKVLTPDRSMSRVRNLHMISIESKKYSGAYIKILHDAGVPPDLNQFTASKWIPHTEKDAGEKIIGDVAEGKANNDADETGARGYG